MKNLSLLLYIMLGIFISICKTPTVVNNRIPLPPPKPSSI